MAEDNATFPVDAYAKYKRATTIFLDWLVRAGGKERSSSQPVELSELQDIANKLVKSSQDPTKSSLKGLSKALGACRCAIELRERVALFFETSPPDDRSALTTHEYFLGRLKDWYSKLDMIDRLQCFEPHASAAEEPPQAHSTNYFEALSIDDDSLLAPLEDDDEGSSDAGSAAANLQSSESRSFRKSERAQRWHKLFDKEFKENVQFELDCFVIELDELQASVFRAYREVKAQRKNLMEAAAVAVAAMECADVLVAKLQRSYPISLASHLVGDLKEYHLQNLVTSAVSASERDKKMGLDFYEYTPRVLPYDIVTMTSLLTSISKFVPENYSRPFPFRRTGDILYCEEMAPEKLSSFKNAFATFLLQQLISLYNALRSSGQSIRSSGLLGSFVGKLDEFFKSKQVTVSLVFAVLCWIQSISALQGDGGLGRNVSLSIHHVWMLSDRVEALSDKAKTSDTTPPPLADLRERLGWFNQNLGLLRTNPILAGLKQLDYHLQYLQIGYEALTDSQNLQAFKTLYDMLVENNPDQAIPQIDRFFDPRQSAGWSSNDAGEIRLSTVSRVFRLMRESQWTAFARDELCSDRAKEQLDEVARTFHKELFETRVLSEDLLALAQDISKLFTNLRAACRPARGRQDTADADAVLAEFLKCSPGSSLYTGVSKAIATAFGKLAEPQWESRYLLFRADSKPVDEEFGTHPLRRETEVGERTVLEQLQSLLLCKSGLAKDQIRYIKEVIKEAPWLVRVVGDTSDGTYTSFSDDNLLCTLFHLAAAGPARDLRLVEWMIQMGALHFQPSRDRIISPGGKELPPLLAVHSAAVAGHTEIVKLILEAEMCRDIDTVTDQGKQSLVHLAVRMGHQGLCDLLIRLQADLQLRDAVGMQAFELASDSEWRMKLEHVTMAQLDAYTSTAAKNRMEKKFELSIKQIHDEELRGLRALEKRQARDRRNAKASSGRNHAKGCKQSHNKKRKGKKNAKK